MVMQVSPYISWAFSNFDLVMFILAIIFIIINRLIDRGISEAQNVFRWIAFFALGFTGIFTFIMHAFFPHFTAHKIGWTTNPFEFEVAVADLALGVLGIGCIRANFGFRLATTIAAVIILWGDAVGHVYQMLAHANYSLGNAGSWLWMDILVPLILLIAILKIRTEGNMLRFYK